MKKEQFDRAQDIVNEIEQRKNYQSQFAGLLKEEFYHLTEQEQQEIVKSFQQITNKTINELQKEFNNL